MKLCVTCWEKEALALLSCVFSVASALSNFILHRKNYQSFKEKDDKKVFTAEGYNLRKSMQTIPCTKHDPFNMVPQLFGGPETFLVDHT